MKKNIIITGGMGYIGSHIYVELFNQYNAIIIDNLCNSKEDALQSFPGYVFHNIDLLNKDDLDFVFVMYKPYAVIHLAGLKSVNESIDNPLVYYQNNLITTINLIEMMDKHKCYNLIFSSSATVYGDERSPLNEGINIGSNISHPYGQTKYMNEIMLENICKSNNKFNIVSLRYFNPVGAHKSRLIGENPNNQLNNIMPALMNSIINQTVFKIYGNNYDTPDGTCIRDFIHVIDLAKCHLVVLNNIDKLCGYHYYNSGTGIGTSIMQLINTFEKVNNIKIKYEIVDRRSGDIDVSYCNPDKIFKELGWKSELGLDDMCIDSWNYFINY